MGVSTGSSGIFNVWAAVNVSVEAEGTGIRVLESQNFMCVGGTLEVA